VKLTVKSDYAARAVLGLARHFTTGQPRRAEDLAAESNIPAKYLVQILIELKAQGIVKSIRGTAGGYQLAKPPAEVALGDILRAMHGEIFDTPALTDANCPAELREAWSRLKISVTASAAAINFQQLLEDGADKGKMYYI